MTDICTLVVATEIVAAALCPAPEPASCFKTADGGREYCIELQHAVCPKPEAVYRCMRDDGTAYALPRRDANLPK